MYDSMIEARFLQLLPQGTCQHCISVALTLTGQHFPLWHCHRSLREEGAMATSFEPLASYAADPQSKIHISKARVVIVIEDPRNSRHDRVQIRKRTWPNLISYNAALSTCSKGEQWQMALSLLSTMARETIEADTISFNSALSSCCEGLQWRRVFQLLQDLPSKHMVPDCIACLACLAFVSSAVSRSGHVDAAQT